MRLAFALPLALLAVSCQRPPPPVSPHYVLGAPYQAGGVWYYPRDSYEGQETGLATVYPSGHPALTADGEAFDQTALAAAHQTLQLPAIARITNLENGLQVLVRINDRGPFVANRLIDLSYTAAAKLDMIREGTTLVEVRALTPGVPDDLTRSAELPPPALYLQAGAFADVQNAQRLLARLQAAGLAGAFIASPLQSKSHLYRVRIGPVGSVAEFDQLASRLAALGIADARLALD